MGAASVPPRAVSVALGIGAFVAGYALTFVYVATHEFRGLIDYGSVSKTLQHRGVDFFAAHGVDFAEIEHDGWATVNREWWTFEYVPGMTAWGSSGQADLAHYLSAGAYLRPTYWHDIAVAPGPLPPHALLLLPAITLLAAGGLAAIWMAGADGPTNSAMAGASIVFGYLPMTIIALHVFSTAGGPWGESLVFPDPVVGIVRAGIVYPVLFGGIGGAAATWLAATSSDSRTAVSRT